MVMRNLNLWVIFVRKRISLYKYMIKIGFNNLNEQMPWSQVRYVSKIIVHPEWDQVNVRNDIALIKLNAQVNYTDQVGPVCIPPSSYSIAERKQSWATGFGKTVEGERHSDYLMQVELPIISEKECQKENGAGIDYELQLCSGKPKAGYDTCQGDSGGPLVAQDLDNNDRWYQIGVTSWGMGCSGAGVYTRVSSYTKWIEKTVFFK
jgi:secreted trypsin-like serine protease